MSTDAPKWKRHLTKALIVVLVIMVCISILQWFVIIALFGFGTEMLKDAMVRQAPEGVDRQYIVNTLDRVKNRCNNSYHLVLSCGKNQSYVKSNRQLIMPLLQANDDEIGSAEEINTLMRYSERLYRIQTRN